MIISRIITKRGPAALFVDRIVDDEARRALRIVMTLDTDDNMPITVDILS